MAKAYFQYYETFEKIVQKFKTKQEQAAFREKIINYGIYGLAPESLSDKEMMVWDIVQDMIDDQLHRRSVNANNRKGKKRTEDIEEVPTVADITTENEKKGTKTNDNDLENPFAEMNRNEMNRNEMNRNERERNETALPPSELSNSIFEIFKSNNLPCANESFIAFLSRDFMNGMQTLHKSHPGLHSDEILRACENYAQVVNDESCYLRNRYSFDRFVELKNFRDFLPANFRIENFKRFDVKTNAEQPTQPNIQFEMCPGCGVKKLLWAADTQRYECTSCRQIFSYEEVHQ